MTQTNILLESGTNELEVVEFFIDEDAPDGGEKPVRTFYGVNVAKVLEIIRLPDLTDMPDASHPSVMGAFDLRSEIVPLIKLDAWVKKEQSRSEHPKVIVTEFNQIITAFMVTGVTRIHRINWENVKAPSIQISSLTSNSVTGIVKLDDRIVFLLDLEKIVATLNPQLAECMTCEADVVRQVEERNIQALIADDSTMVRHMIASLLVDSGFHVTQAINGKEAWAHLMEYKEESEREGKPITDYVDIVISDIEMPVMDGHNLTKRIKDDPTLKVLPVMLCSSLITDNLFHKGQSVGANEQISKANLNKLPHRALDLVKKFDMHPNQTRQAVANQ